MTGIDADPRVLKIAARRARPSGADVRLVCARAERTGLSSRSFDVVLSSLAFHHLPLQAKEDAAAEIVRLLRVGGVFVLVDLRPILAFRRPLRPGDRYTVELALHTNKPETLDRLLTEAGPRVEHIPAPRWSVPLWTFALRATKPDAMPTAAGLGNQ